MATIQVAETLDVRKALARTILIETLWRQALLLGVVAAVVIAVVQRATRPVRDISAQLRTRREGDLTPLSVDDAPQELRPVLDATNGVMARLSRLLSHQKRFVRDASHQLRTPLAVLRTQLDYALRESDPAEARAALLAMRGGLDQAQRTAAQMLALARARGADTPAGSLRPVALTPLAQDVIRQLYGLARQKRQTIALEGGELDATVTGVEWLLREALVNLMDNAIKYTPEEGAITLRIERTPGGMVLSVRDTGPGMTETDIRKAGRRFRRGQAGKRGHGAGLGLAIVHTIMQRHGGALRIEPASPGVRVSLVFPGDQGFPGKSPA
jgi:two-component system sensor histidine kinase TctE